MAATPNLDELKEACGSEDLSVAFSFLFSHEIIDDEGFLIRVGEECNQLRAKIIKRDQNICELESLGALTEADSKTWDCLVETQERGIWRLRHLTSILVEAREGVVEKKAYVTTMAPNED